MSATPCPNCGVMVRGGAERCAWCGTAVAAPAADPGATPPNGVATAADPTTPLVKPRPEPRAPQPPPGPKDADATTPVAPPPTEPQAPALNLRMRQRAPAPPPEQAAPPPMPPPRYTPPPPTPTPPRPSAEPIQVPRRRKRRVAGPILLTLLVLALVAGAGWYAFLRPPPPPPPVPPPPPQAPVASAPIDLQVTGVTASSVRPAEGRVGYEPDLVLDGDLTTAWISSSGRLVGESLTFTLGTPARITELLVANGYQKPGGRFLGNGRAGRLTLRFDDGTETDVTIQDVEGVQTVAVTGPAGQPAPLTSTVVVTAAEGVPGGPGNLALSTVELRGVPG